MPDSFQNAEQRALSAAAGSDHTDEFAVLHRKGHVIQCREMMILFSVVYRQMVDLDLTHMFHLTVHRPRTCVSEKRDGRALLPSCFMNGLLVQVKVLFQRLVNRIIRGLGQEAGERLVIDRGVVEGVYIVILNVTQFDDGSL